MAIDFDIHVALADSPSFRWMGGMRTFCGVRIKKGWLLDTWVNGDIQPVPDIEDPATKGCLLLLAREIEGKQSIFCICSGGKWGVYSPKGVLGSTYETEGTALAMFILQK